MLRKFLSAGEQVGKLGIKILVGSLILGGGREGSPGPESDFVPSRASRPPHGDVSASPRVITLQWDPPRSPQCQALGRRKRSPRCVLFTASPAERTQRGPERRELSLHGGCTSHRTRPLSPPPPGHVGEHGEP